MYYDYVSYYHWGKLDESHMITVLFYKSHLTLLHTPKQVPSSLQKTEDRLIHAKFRMEVISRAAMANVIAT